MNPRIRLGFYLSASRGERTQAWLFVKKMFTAVFYRVNETYHRRLGVHIDRSAPSDPARLTALLLTPIIRVIRGMTY